MLLGDQERCPLDRLPLWAMANAFRFSARSQPGFHRSGDWLPWGAACGMGTIDRRLSPPSRYHYRCILLPWINEVLVADERGRRWLVVALGRATV